MAQTIFHAWCSVTCVCMLVMFVDFVGVCWHKPSDKVVSIARMWSSRSSQCDQRQFIIHAVYFADDFCERARRSWSQEQSAADEIFTIRWLRKWSYFLLVSVVNPAVIAVIVIQQIDLLSYHHCYYARISTKKHSAIIIILLTTTMFMVLSSWPWSRLWYSHICAEKGR